MICKINSTKFNPSDNYSKIFDNYSSQIESANKKRLRSVLTSASRDIKNFTILFDTYCLKKVYINPIFFDPFLSGALPNLVTLIKKHDNKFEEPLHIQTALKIVKFQEAVHAFQHYSLLKLDAGLVKGPGTFTAPLRAGAILADLICLEKEGVLSKPRILLCGPGFSFFSYPIQLANFLQAAPSESTIIVIDADQKVIESCESLKDSNHFDNQMALSLSVMLGNKQALPADECPYDELAERLLTPFNKKNQFECHVLDLNDINAVNTVADKVSIVAATFCFVFVTRQKKRTILQNHRIIDLNQPCETYPYFAILDKDLYTNPTITLINEIKTAIMNLYLDYFKLIENKGKMYVEIDALSSLFTHLPAEHPEAHHPQKFEEELNKVLEPNNRYITIKEVLHPYCYFTKEDQSSFNAEHIIRFYQPSASEQDTHHAMLLKKIYAITVFDK